ncbi:MAG: hypothetical protein RI988_372 [Pseudomonadota bacterium]|jgi:uncharacterized protein (DUF2164 family)
MALELPPDIHAEALASLERYLDEHLGERLGNVATSALLNFFVEEIGPAIYNRAVADVQQRLTARVQDLDFEVHEEAFTYWSRRSAKGRGRKA